MKRLVIFTVAVCILMASAAWAAPVTEQIYFTKSTTLTAGSYTLRFSLWNIVTGGTPAANRVWWETKTLNMTGPSLATYLGTVIDNSKRSGPLGEVDFSEQYWVQVEKKESNGSFTVLGARTRFSVVPYAMHSLSSDRTIQRNYGNGGERIDIPVLGTPVALGSRGLTFEKKIDNTGI